MTRQWVAGILLALTLVAGAHADTRETMQKNLARYEKYLGDPVDQFQFWTLYKWQLVGPTKVVVWSTINDAYLVTVEDPCPDLEWANTIALTSKQSHFVSAKFDSVTFGKGQCQIKQIQPIDYKRMLKDGPDDAGK